MSGRVNNMQRHRAGRKEKGKDMNSTIPRTSMVEEDELLVFAAVEVFLTRQRGANPI
jgi:hypothetical protein